MSIIECCIEDFTKRGNLFEVIVRLPNAFYDGDQIPIEAVSSCTNKKEAMEDVCHKLIS